MQPHERRQEREHAWMELALAIYRAARGDPRLDPFAWELAEQLAWPEERVQEVARELEGHGLLDYATTGPSYQLTRPGTDAIEEAIRGGAGDAELAELLSTLENQRTRVLRHVHAASDRKAARQASTTDAMQALGLARDELLRASIWLSDQDLMELLGDDGMALTDAGIDRAELAEAHRSRSAAPGLAPVDRIWVADAADASVAATDGSADSDGPSGTAATGLTDGPTVATQISRDPDQLGDLRLLLDRIRQGVNLDADARAALDAAAAQAARGRSDSGIIRAALGELRVFSRDAGAGALGTQITAFLGRRAPR